MLTFVRSRLPGAGGLRGAAGEGRRRRAHRLPAAGARKLPVDAPPAAGTVGLDAATTVHVQPSALSLAAVRIGATPALAARLIKLSSSTSPAPSRAALAAASPSRATGVLAHSQPRWRSQSVARRSQGAATAGVALAPTVAIVQMSASGPSFANDVLKFLEARQPALAALVCLLVSPVGTGRDGVVHVNLALQLTKVVVLVRRSA